jgi:WD40 repeat protein
MDLNFDNSVLITGDTKGFIYLWDISQLTSSKDIEFFEPKATLVWKAHDLSITTLKYVFSKVGQSNEFNLSSSVDWCCRLWTLNYFYK